MCRIAGIVSNKNQGQQASRLVTSMCNDMQHGGPDDSGIWNNTEGGVVLGHRRLSIIDLTRNGHQPMSNPGKNAWITFNGEIYNYRELKRELQKLGAQFASETDTEVILQAYLHWGTASFNKLKGMFAFALYDVAAAKTYLVRDTSAIKPLYYTTADGQLIFASEIKAFKAAGAVTEADKRWPVWLLSFGHIPEPYTTLKNVFSLPKGHFLCWNNATNTHAITKYSYEQAGAIITDQHIAQQGIYHQLNQAVKRQLISDAPIGVFLSGGIDSSILTLLANEENLQQLKTISIYFDEKQYDERSYQNAVLQKINGENFSHLVNEQDFKTFLPKILDTMDMPTTDGINSWFISKYAHDDGLKAVLSGIGADELFGGYPSFARIKFLRYIRTIPGWALLRTSLLPVKQVKRLSYLVHNHPAADYLFLRGLFAIEDIAKILDMNEAEIITILFGSHDFSQPTAYDKLQAAWFETNMYMQNQLLRDTDVMSMSHGLEVRVPFLDEDFRAFINRIAPQIRFDSARPKKILIDSFKALLPRNVWDRPKMGFTFPLQQWMKNEKNIADESMYNTKFAKNIIKEFKNDRVHWSRAFALYQVQKHV
ncbi:hypothetical protein A0256_10600 [Mucilaginibacter sp. PAMC 26640]|nr:hypothetical protein A0256_10600 [Mucilaginibacter sp. PAMC 26640]